jgi:hypothetical protein
VRGQQIRRVEVRVDPDRLPSPVGRGKTVSQQAIAMPTSSTPRAASLWTRARTAASEVLIGAPRYDGGPPAASARRSARTNQPSRLAASCRSTSDLLARSARRATRAPTTGRGTRPRAHRGPPPPRPVRGRAAPDEPGSRGRSTPAARPDRQPRPAAPGRADDRQLVPRVRCPDCDAVGLVMRTSAPLAARVVECITCDALWARSEMVGSVGA